MNLKCSSLIAVVVVLTSSWVAALPFSNFYERHYASDRNEWTNRFGRDVVVSEAEYQQVLEGLQEEAAFQDSSNNVVLENNDESIAEILRRSDMSGEELEHQQHESSSSKISDRELEECTICLMPIEQRAATIPCGHKFHRNCIISWLRQNTEAASKCPICRESLQFPRANH